MRAGPALLGQTLEVVSVSDSYPNRGRRGLARAYVEVRLDPERTPPGPAEPANHAGDG
jgi:hypothetical protein